MKLAENVVHFTRILRGAGIPIGSDKMMDAVRALPLTGLERREDWHATLSALFLTRHEQQAIFDEAFDALLARPGARGDACARCCCPRSKAARRATNPVGASPKPCRLPCGRKPAREQPPEITIDATLTFEASERLRQMDFEKMTAAEWNEARALVARMRLPVPDVRTRRYRRSSTGTAIDLPATLRAMARSGGDITKIARRSPGHRPPPLVVLCDISGSMHRYTRMFLHFVHALTRGRQRVSTLVFGTRLTNVTRPLRDRDVDEALARVSQAVPDWAGGTRIASSLHEFNFRWARRLLGQNACVLLVTDGLERDDAGALATEMERLSRASHRLVWLNPLLRFEGFEPKASGIASMLPHVDEFLPVHNLASLADLARELS